LLQKRSMRTMTKKVISFLGKIEYTPAANIEEASATVTRENEGLIVGNRKIKYFKKIDNDDVILVAGSLPTCLWWRLIALNL